MKVNINLNSYNLNKYIKEYSFFTVKTPSINTTSSYEGDLSKNFIFIFIQTYIIIIITIHISHIIE